ncbi:MAG: Smr/MutS family protein [Deltaproteobacteria bacterium]|jgi:DNA-nicking Smr family endonuclease|nr:Smr/MutS family protein [Deltaproteobacteria bacterium]
MGKNQRPPKGQVMPTLDLHGFKVADVIDAVDRFLVQNQKRGAHKVRIITGRGTGAVRKEALDWLKRGGFPYTQENEGSYFVHLGD